MKKIILLALISLILVGCREPVVIDNKSGLEIVIIDNCEYLKCNTCGIRNNVYSHKGNCRFCAKRKRQELEELVIKLNKE